MLDKEARAYFIDQILKKPTQGNIDREKLINFTSNMSGADLEKVGREASLEVIRKNKKALTEDILLEQINIVKYGHRITNIPIEKLVSSTAYHEAGHAVISSVLMPEVQIEQITVAPRGKALGFVSYSQDSHYSNYTYPSIKNEISVLYAGRVAQMKFMGEDGLDAGASNDLERATNLAFYAVAHLGMDKEIGYINLENLEKLINEGELSKQIQERALNLLKQEKIRCEKLVEQHWNKIDQVAKVLIDKEFIDEDEFQKIIK